MTRRYAGRTLKSITPEEAQQIIHVSSMYDMPMIDYVSTPSTLHMSSKPLTRNALCKLQYALSFALFKTYAIVCILP